MSIFLGIDIGTSGTKTLAIDPKGKILAEATESYPAYHPKPLWSEQDPEDWWRATVGHGAIGRAKGEAEAGRCESDRPVGPDARLRVSRQARIASSAGRSFGTISGPPPNVARSSGGPAGGGS